MRVPMRGTGAERPVVAEKSGKLDGAKGSRHPVSDARQPRGGGAPRDPTGGRGPGSRALIVSGVHQPSPRSLSLWSRRGLTVLALK